MAYCRECNRAFKSEDALQQHLRDSPAHTVSYDCDEYNHTFNSENDLQQPLQDSPTHRVNYDYDKFIKSKGETRTSFMFPSLHQDIVNAVSDKISSPWFCKNNSDKDSNNEYTTHVIGKFRCKNCVCSTNGWGSKKVAILIRGYAGNGYNAEVFNQRCKSCNQLGTLTLDEKSYVDRVAYRIQKWAGVRMEQQHYASKGGMPHKKDFCEGCKRGVCRQTWDYN